MEKDFGSWFHHHLSDAKNPLTFAAQFNAMPARMSHCTNDVSSKENLPAFPFSGLPHFDASQQLSEPHRWFCCLPRFCQTVTPAPSSDLKEMLHPSPNPTLGCAQKRFLVFDQSGDQTTLFFHPVVGSHPVQYPTHFFPKHGDSYDLNKIGFGTEGEIILHREPFLTYESEENNRNDTYHEDTEEINALLYSEDEYDEDGIYSHDDELVSTGHSPSGMIDYGKQELLEESEKIASSNAPNKRLKLFGGGYVVPSLMDTATSVKSQRCFDCENDVKSSCADGKSQGLGEFGDYTGNKRPRKDKIRETVGILQSIIPGGVGKDAIEILDEAIDYLRSLKCTAKALGVDTLR